MSLETEPAASDGHMVAASGWCAPSDQVFNLSVISEPIDGRISAVRGGLSFGPLNFTDPLPPHREPKPAPEPLPPAPEGAPAGHWEFGVTLLDPHRDTDVAWSDWDYYGQSPNYRTPEKAREGEHFRPGAEIVRRWQPDPFPYEPHVPIVSEESS